MTPKIDRHEDDGTTTPMTLVPAALPSAIAALWHGIGYTEDNPTPEMLVEEGERQRRERSGETWGIADEGLAAARERGDHLAARVAELEAERDEAIDSLTIAVELREEQVVALRAALAREQEMHERTREEERRLGDAANAAEVEESQVSAALAALEHRYEQAQADLLAEQQNLAAARQEAERYEEQAADRDHWQEAVTWIWRVCARGGAYRGFDDAAMAMSEIADDLAAARRMAGEQWREKLIAEEQAAGLSGDLSETGARLATEQEARRKAEGMLDAAREAYGEDIERRAVLAKSLIEIARQEGADAAESRLARLLEAVRGQKELLADKYLCNLGDRVREAMAAVIEAAEPAAEPPAEKTT